MAKIRVYRLKANSLAANSLAANSLIPSHVEFTDNDRQRIVNDLSRKGIEVDPANITVKGIVDLVYTWLTTKFEKLNLKHKLKSVFEVKAWVLDTLGLSKNTRPKIDTLVSDGIGKGGSEFSGVSSSLFPAIADIWLAVKILTPVIAIYIAVSVVLRLATWLANLNSNR